MSEVIVEKTWSITAVGVGRPDYTPAVAASKPTVIVDQLKWSLLVTRRSTDVPPNPIPANTVVEIDAYTVPDGYQLAMGGGVVTCNVSCIQKIVMAHTPGIVGDYLYDMKGEIVFGPLSSTIINPGEHLMIYIYNNDDADRDFSVSLVGILEKVP